MISHQKNFFIHCLGGCGNDAFSCWNGTCIDSTKICDGKPDCSDGFDEDNAVCSKSPCSTYNIL